MARGLLFVALLVFTACGQASAPPAQAPARDAPTPATPAASKPTTGATTQSTAWDRNLIALLPQIDACMAKQPDAREVTYAGERAGGVFVRLSSPQNSFDCIVRSGVAQVLRRDDALSIDGENAAIFIRGPGDNPGGECYQAPEVHDASGALVGWMVDPEGC